MMIIKRTMAAFLLMAPLACFATTEPQVLMDKAPQEAENTGFICLSMDLAHRVDDSIQLASDRRVSNPTVFVFDPKHYTWAAYRDGQLVKTGRASGGSNYCKDLGGLAEHLEVNFVFTR